MYISSAGQNQFRSSRKKLGIVKINNMQSFNDCLFSFINQKAVILHIWYKIGGKIFICVGHLMNSDLK